MHRTIVGLSPDDPREVDHINGDRLDNRRANLRVVTRSENAQNNPSRRGTSRFRGVYRSRNGKRWRAQGKVNGEVTYLGTYDTELEAARVAAAWRREHLLHSPGLRDELPAEVDENEATKEALPHAA